MEAVEYLLSYGLLGEFGRFRASPPVLCRRGNRAVVRTHRGLEIGQVLCPATPRHAHYLPNTTVGSLLRLVTVEDEQKLAPQRQRALEVLDRAGRLTGELQLPLEFLDSEMLLDGEHVVLQQLRWGECDVRPLVSTLSREFALHVLLQDLGRQAEEAEAHGCGREDCGKGHCSSCSSGGCSSCGSSEMDMKAYFAELRQKMEQRVRFF
jgi:cell fate regulator YaaT (PSP1 superfamily)